MEFPEMKSTEDFDKAVRALAKELSDNTNTKVELLRLNWADQYGGGGFIVESTIDIRRKG